MHRSGSQNRPLSLIGRDLLQPMPPLSQRVSSRRSTPTETAFGAYGLSKLRVPNVQKLIISRRSHRFMQIASGTAQGRTDVHLGVGQFRKRYFQSPTFLQSFQVMEDGSHD